MTLSTMDIPFSPDMGGKEALSALGYSRASKDRFCERWEKGDDRICEITLVMIANYWYAYSNCTDDDGTYSIAFTHDEMLACARRIEELEAGDAE